MKQGFKPDYEPAANPELSYKLIENPCCSFFGCGRQLTRQEALFGNRCIEHSDKGKIVKSKILTHAGH